MREERIADAVDAWLDTLTDPEHLDATVEAILAADRDTSPEAGRCGESATST